MSPSDPSSAGIEWPALLSPVLSHLEAMDIHGRPVACGDIVNLLRWAPSFEPLKSELASLPIAERRNRGKQHDKADLIARFVIERFEHAQSPFFTYDDFARWNDERTKPRSLSHSSMKYDELSLEVRSQRQRAWAKNHPGAFSSWYRSFPCRAVEEGKTVGLAIVAVDGNMDSASLYCVVYQYELIKSKFTTDRRTAQVASNGSAGEAHGAIATRVYETKPAPSKAAPVSVSLVYDCVPPSGLRGIEQNNNWLLNAISFLDGMTSSPHKDHLGVQNLDVHSPSVLEAARLKLESEEEGFRFLVENHTPVGYASLWRVAIESSNDLFGWIKVHGTMPHDKADLTIAPWQPSEPPKVWIGYVSSLRIHPRCRYHSGDSSGLKARMTLFYGVVRMLEEYALRGQLFAELIVWTTHIHERQFLHDLRGEHPREAGENHNIVRLRLWPPPVKGRVFKRLSDLYSPHSHILTEASDKIRRYVEHGDPFGADEAQ